MKLGTSGIVLKQTATELLIKSIRKVHAGEIWLDSYTTAAVIRQFVANDEAPAHSLPPAAYSSGTGDTACTATAESPR